MLQGALEADYNVSAASTVREALALLRMHTVDVVLLDSVLPDGRGDEVACVAESLGAAVIEMSGYPQAMADLERSGRPHLFKPFGTVLLNSAIASTLLKNGKDGT